MLRKISILWFVVILFNGCVITINSDNHRFLSLEERKQIRNFSDNASDSAVIKEIKVQDLKAIMPHNDFTWLILAHNACVMYSPSFKEWIALSQKNKKFSLYFVFNHYHISYLRQFQTDCLPAQTAYVIANNPYGSNANCKQKRFVRELCPKQKISLKSGYPVHLIFDRKGNLVFQANEATDAIEKIKKYILTH
jgi:hypothetical protein